MADATNMPTFLGLKGGLRNPPQARFHVLPAPLEASVSYGSGCAAGPQAIIEASSYVELFDGTSSIPAASGIVTEPPIDLARATSDEAIRAIARRVRAVLAGGSIPVLLGGEHSLTLGAVEAILERCGHFGVVQFDAHADLRDTYGGDPYSHACVMRRVLDLGLPIFQVGVRSCCVEEHRLRTSRAIPQLDVQTARVLASEHAPSSSALGPDTEHKAEPLKAPETVLPVDFPEAVYITFDVDAFDPSLVPATGTPEPGGLFWHDALAVLTRVVHGRRVVGFDVVELAPIPGLHAADFIVAKLVYVLMGIILREARK